MIDPQSLMIGNWVLYKGANTQWDISDYYEIDNSSIMDVIEPIPLTEQWLIDLGFEKEYNNPLYDWGSDILHLCYDPDENNYYIPEMSDTIIDKVHQLQNLYFALTGKQLKK